MTAIATCLKSKRPFRICKQAFVPLPEGRQIKERAICLSVLLSNVNMQTLLYEMRTVKTEFTDNIV